MNYEIKRFLDERGIDTLYHFTPVENLESILKNGLLSVDNLQKRRLPYFNNDPLRLDGVLNGICTSIEFPNYKMFYLLRKNGSRNNDQRSGNWCVVELDANLLAEKDCLFYADNAASKNEARKSFYDKVGIVGLRRMFVNYSFRNSIGIPPYIPTNPQAEVQILETIEPSYIRAVHFEDPIVKGFLDNSFKNIYNKKTIEFKVTKDLFSPRPDYRHWA